MRSIAGGGRRGDGPVAEPNQSGGSHRLACHSASELPLVSVIVPVYNEAWYIESCLEGIVQQTYPAERLEVLVVDGMSTDCTREIIRNVAQAYPFIRLLDNPMKVTSEAVNIGVRASSGQMIAIVGGHSVISPSYIAKAVSYLSRPDQRIGGVGPTLKNVGKGLLGNLVAHALSSPFGVGNSRFRFSKKSQFVDTIAYGTYRRGIFDEVGLWDTGLVRNQDIEFNHRVRQAGWRLLLAPDMGCKYYTRTTMRGFVSQNYGNGYWNALTFSQRPSSLSWRHFVPLAFVLGLLLTTVAALVVPWGWLSLLAIVLPYSMGATIVSATDSVRERQCGLLLLAFIFLLLHISYGIGSLAGFGRIIWSKTQRPSPGSGAGVR